jgi:hypothetical protein
MIQGWVTKAISWLDTQNNKIADWMLRVLQQMGQEIRSWLVDQNNKVENWIDEVIAKQQKKLIKFFDPLIEASKNVGKAIFDFILGPLGHLNDEWQRFLDSLPGTGDKFEGGGGGKTRQGTTGGWDDGGGHVWNPPGTIGRTGPIRALTYGPHSEGATSADLRQKTGAWVDEYANGKLVRHAQILDKSFYGPNRPKYNTIENYNDINLGKIQLKRSPIQGPATQEELQHSIRSTIMPQSRYTAQVQTWNIG